MTAAELLSRRAEVRAELEAGTRHVLGVLRDPDPELRQAVVGDVLCWCEGLDEAAVSRILLLARVAWGKALTKLTNPDIAAVCFQIQQRHPEAWERWRDTLQQRKAAA